MVRFGKCISVLKHFIFLGEKNICTTFPSFFDFNSISRYAKSKKMENEHPITWTTARHSTLVKIVKLKSHLAQPVYCTIRIRNLATGHKMSIADVWSEFVRLLRLLRSRQVINQLSWKMKLKSFRHQRTKISARLKMICHSLQRHQPVPHYQKGQLSTYQRPRLDRPDQQQM